MPYAPLDRTSLTRALRRLGELAVAEGVVLEVALYGGAVFALVYESRDATKDVDAIVRPGDVGLRLAARVADELRLPADWLNDDVARFLAEKEDKRRLDPAMFGPGLIVSVPTASYLLALKMHAFRSPLPGYAGDHDDIVFLLRKMDLRSAAEAAKHHLRFFPHDVLSDERRDLLAALVVKAHAS
jgi:hypothetical protein